MEIREEPQTTPWTHGAVTEGLGFVSLEERREGGAEWITSDPPNWVSERRPQTQEAKQTLQGQTSQIHHQTRHD